MSNHAQIIFHNVTFTLANGRTLFKDLNLTFANEKVALLGKNGVGKSTLLKLITGELIPTAGKVMVTGDIVYLPQLIAIPPHQTIAEFLAIQTKLTALANILAGSIAEQDFTDLNEDWDLKDRLAKHLAAFGLDNIELSRNVTTLSGGELTRLTLAKLFWQNPDFIILDEPTNNLDIAARQFLYQALAAWNKGAVIVSHDRMLLRQMQKIVELTPQGLITYGGNYDHYLEQKNLQETAIAQTLAEAKKALTKSKLNVQKDREKTEQRKAQGKKERAQTSQPKMVLDARKMQSEKTDKTLKTRGAKMLKEAEQQLQAARDKLIIQEKIAISLPQTALATTKRVLDIEHITFAYTKTPIFKDFSLSIVGPERAAIIGKNGSGKTTLIKLILGELTPHVGTIKIGIEHISYLDQKAEVLNPDLSLVENFQLLNPELTINDAHRFLAQFLFRNVDALKKARDLSGGEKLRAALACVLMAKHPPQLIILDEPTNHLDLESIENLEAALNCYQGALLVISHDEEFLHNIAVTKIIQLRSNS